MTVTIKECVHPAELFRHYDGQTKRQPCYIELDLPNGVMFADWDAIVGSGAPGSVYHGFDRRWGIPCLTAKAANRIMQEILPLAERMVADWEREWRNGDAFAVLGEDAQAAEAEICERLGLHLPAHMQFQAYEDESDLVAVWPIDGVTNGCEASEYGITADTTDERLDEIEKEILSDLDSPSGVAVCHGLDSYLRGLRTKADED